MELLRESYICEQFQLLAMIGKEHPLPCSVFCHTDTDVLQWVPLSGRRKKKRKSKKEKEGCKKCCKWTQQLHPSNPGSQTESEKICSKKPTVECRSSPSEQGPKTEFFAYRSRSQFK
jgi:hypothetical protein